MKRIFLGVYVWSVLAGLVASLLLVLSAYVGGYFLLADSEGLFPSKAIFDVYDPAMRFQRWASDEPVSSGYVDSQGRRYLLRLPWPPQDIPLPPPIRPMPSGVYFGDDGPISIPVAALESDPGPPAPRSR